MIPDGTIILTPDALLAALGTSRRTAAALTGLPAADGWALVEAVAARASRRLALGSIIRQGGRRDAA